MKQMNLYAKNGNCYSGANYFTLSRAAQGRLGLWLTDNQIRNDKGKYLFLDLKALEGAKSEVITKSDRLTGETIYTEVINIEDTNFSERYPKVFSNLKSGMTPSQAIEASLSEPLIGRAMSTAQTPKTFWQKVAAAVF